MQAGYFVLSLLDYYVASIPMLFCALMEVVVVSYVYGWSFKIYKILVLIIQVTLYESFEIIQDEI